MSKRIVYKKHLEYVSSLPCFISRAGFYSCNGPVQVHHLLKPSDGKRGWSLKAGDNQVIPLCMYHHQKLHTKFGDEHKFLKNYGFKDDAAIKHAEEIYQQYQYENSDDYKDDLPF